jgi:hypothetical protein
MPSREELVRAHAAIQAVLDGGALERLRAIPGVRHVSVGLKVQRGKVSRDLCIRVYVKAKRLETELSPDERIPPEIDGIPIDVNVTRTPTLTIDRTRYRPLQGGSLISNRVIGLNQSGTEAFMELGTFGCTATRTSDGSPVLLTNWHVLMANGGRVGEPIFQPAPLRIPRLDPAQLPLRPTDREDAIAFIVDGRVTDKVDAGIARLDVSSCCRCCGLDFRDEIVGLSEGGRPPSNSVLGMRAAVAGSTVYKVGATTGRTVGTVVDATTDDLQGSQDGVDYTLTGQIEVASEDPDEYFLSHGDSGAALIDEEGWIVGLLFGIAGEPPDARAYANHIADVCSALGITINLTQPHGTAGARVAVPRATFPQVLSPTGAELYAKARARLQADQAGAWLWALAEKYREEIVSLVTTERRVSVVWHRVGGPAVFQAALNALRAGDDETLPMPPGGGTLEDALARVGGALAAHGTADLRAALARHRGALLAAVHGSHTVSELLEKLRPHTLAGAPA